MKWRNNIIIVLVWRTIHLTHAATNINTYFDKFKPINNS